MPHRAPYHTVYFQNYLVKHLKILCENDQSLLVKCHFLLPNRWLKCAAWRFVSWSSPMSNIRKLNSLGGSWFQLLRTISKNQNVEKPFDGFRARIWGEFVELSLVVSADIQSSSECPKKGGPLIGGKLSTWISTLPITCYRKYYRILSTITNLDHQLPKWNVRF